MGDDACASCHAKQAASFPGTAMGRSFALPSTLLKEGKLRLPPGGVTFTHARSGCRYRVFEEGGVLKQSEIRLDDLGREAFTDTRSIAFVLGSGDRGQTFLVRQGGRLYQSPIAFRKDRDGWGMAAGYDAAEHSHFFRPGLPLSDFFAVLHAERAPAAGAKPGAPSGDEGIEVVGHVERLRASRCWRASGGKITCLTCHDPHRTPHGEEAARQFGAACLTCRKLDDCRLTEMSSGSTPPGIDPHDCVRCHMAKLPPTDAPHPLFTDHLIARRPAQAPPARETPSREDKVLVSFLEVGRGSRRDLGVGCLLFASRIGESRYGDRGASILEPMLPGSRGDVKRTGRKADSMALIQAAVKEDPDDAPARPTLGDLLMDAGKPTEAEAQIREAVRLDPALAPAHALAPRLASARLGLERLLHADPNQQEARGMLRRIDAGKP